MKKNKGGNITNNFLFYISAFGILTSMPINLFGILIPNGLLAICLVLIILNIKTYSLSYLINLVLLILFLIFHLLVVEVNLNEYFKSISQLLISILIGFYIYQLLSTIKIEKLYQLTFTVLLVVIIGSLLEIINTPVKSLSDYFRTYFLYSSGSSDIRDIVHYSYARPYFFTTEPSHVAKFIFIFILLLNAVRPSKKLIHVYGLAILSMVVIRSPILIFLPFCIFIINYFENKKINFTFFLSVIIIILITFPLAYFLMEGRIKSIISGQDVSFFIRVASLPLIFNELAPHNFLYGVGIGGIELLESAVMESYIKSGFGKMLSIQSNANRIANFLFTSLIYFGVLLGPIFYFLVYNLLGIKKLKNKYLFLFFLFIYSFFEGGLVTARVWIYLFLLIYIFSVQKKG